MSTSTETMTTTKTFDCVVLGAGPAGCTTAATLAAKGHRVALLEREQGPRYHVGESLLPFCHGTLERIGALDAVRGAGFVDKLSVQFVTPEGQQTTPFYFEDHMDHPAMRTWQVDRAGFDQLLMKTAADRGAEVFEGTRATKPLRDEAGAWTGVLAERDVDGVTERVAFEAPITVDTTGRDGFTMRHERWKVREPRLDRVALWTYVAGAVRDEGRDEGATTIASLPHGGWFWYIPVAGGKVSVGVVARAADLFDGADRDRDKAFERQVALQPWIAERIAPGKVAAPYRVTSDYSYRSQHCAGDGVVLAGDAFAFLDPVFSSGMFLALTGGEAVAESVDEALRAGRADAAAFEGYAAWLRRQIEPMRRLVFAFYDERFSFGKLIRRHPEVRPLVTDVLIGHMDRDFQPLFEAMAEVTPPPEAVRIGGVKPSGRHPAPDTSAEAMAQSAA